MISHWKNNSKPFQKQIQKMKIEIHCSEGEQLLTRDRFQKQIQKMKIEITHNKRDEHHVQHVFQKQIQKMKIEIILRHNKK